MSVFVFSFLILLSLCDSSDVFHEGSKVTFYPNYKADFFGYTVIFGESGLITGAPKAYDAGSASHPGVVFNCPTADLETKNVSCQPMALDNNARPGSLRDFYKDDMWFGASIAVIPTGKLLVCAPRWARPYQDTHLLANGACFMHNKRRSISMYPLQNMRHQAFMTSGTRKEYGEYGTHLNFYAYAQAGMAVKVTENSTLIIGAPGLLQWTGGIVEYVFNQDVNSIYLPMRPVVNPYYTPDVGPDDYLGYSVESGVFEDGGRTLYVAGAPRAKLGFGQVLVFEPSTHDQQPLKIRAKLEGPQLGAYFGASLVSLDVNSDGRTDLLVGAPNYVGKGEDIYDQGAVFVYLNKEESTGFILDYAGQVRGSEAVGARFGTAIADLGDLDGDGFRDVAVGAPWENNGIGAVYIYRGDKQGLRSQYDQRIVASESRGFGMSIAKGHDVDGNKCNDLAIGAYASGTAYIYRCMRTMQVSTKIKIPQALDLPQNATNFTAMFCITASPEKDWPHEGMELKAKITVDPEGNRAKITGNEEYTVKVKPGTDQCEEQVVEVKPTADLSRPIAIIFDLEPVDEKNSTTFSTHATRLSEDSNLHSEFDIQLTRDCGDDLICRPWLQMTLETMANPYVPGTDGRLGAIIRVVNKDEPAYGIRVHLSLPAQPKRVPKLCTLQALNMTCDLPSPLYRNQSITWEVELEYALNTTDEEDLFIDAVLEDPGFNRNVSDEAAQELVMVIVPEANFNITGKALPNATVAVSREKLAEGSQIPFVHYFEVTNAGPSDWLALDALIHLPEHVTLATSIDGCVTDNINNGTILECTWSVPAKVSLPIKLPLRFDLKAHGNSLLTDTTRNATTTLQLLEQNKTASISTSLVLDPALPIWPPIVGGIVVGLPLLATLVYVLKKCGFFSRKRLEDYNKLQRSESNQGLGDACDQISSQNPSTSQESPTQDTSSFSERVSFQGPGSSSSTPTILPESSVANDSSQKLLFETDSE